MSLTALDEIAADLRPFDASTAPGEVHSALQQHRQVLRSLGGDVAATSQAIARMVPEMEKRLEQARKDSRAAYVPTGDSALLDARYLMPDGGVRWTPSASPVLMPDGSEARSTVGGLLSDIPCTREQAEMQTAYQRLCVAYDVVSRAGRAPMSHPLVVRAWVEFRGAAMSIGGEVGKAIKRIMTDPAEMKRAITSASGAGGQLLSVPTLSVVRRPADLARRLVGQFRVEQVGAPQFKPPIVTGRALAKKRGVTTDDPARYPVRTWTTSDETVNVVNQELMTLVDPLFIEDNTVVDPIGLITTWLGEGWADTWEMSYLHADTNATHQDTIASWTVGGYYAAGDLDGSNSPLKWWIGLRGRALDDSNTASGGGSFTASTHFAALELLGTHAARRPIIITGLHCLYTQLLDYSEFLTVDKMGAMATLLTGQIGSIAGTPVVISQFISNDFDTSSGVYTGSNAGTEMVYTSLDAWTYYEYMGGAEDFDVSRQERGARYIGGVRRGVLKPVCLSTEKPAAILYNL
jgi:hypothetical protein